MWPPSNPFGDSTRYPGAQPPVVALLRDTLVSTAAAGAPEHAEALFVELDARGEQAWHEAALLLTQHLLAWGDYPPGEDGVREYAAEQPLYDPRAPALALLHATVKAYLRGEDSAAFSVLVDAPGQHLRGTVRLLFVMAAATGDVPADRLDALLASVCKDIR